MSHDKLPPDPRAIPIEPGHLVCKSLTVKDADGGASVAICAFGGTAGVWVNTGRSPSECVGLVAEPGNGCYLCVWPEESKGFKLPVALTADGLQVPSKDNPDGRLFIPLADIVAHFAPKKPESV